MPDGPIYPSLPLWRVWCPPETGVGREDPGAVRQDQQVGGRRQPGQGWQGAGNWGGAWETVFRPGGQARAGPPGERDGR